jgi:pimeloyl-ACP methyl ester carboxylesterase
LRRAAPLVTALALGLLVLAGASCESAPWSGHYARIRGIRLYYEVHGRGAPLLLLHGGGGSGRSFSDQIPAFAKHFRVILPDLRAQGRTSDGPGPLTYHGMAEDIVALLDHLKVPRADVMGWSDGGIIGLDLAINHPERVKHLVSFGANFTPDGYTPAALDWISTANAESFGADSRREYERVAPDPSHYETTMNKVLALWRTQPNFSLAELGSIRTPTLIAAGEHDMVRQDHTEALAHAIPGARLWIVAGASHDVISEEPEMVNRTVTDFLLDRTGP